MIGDIKSILKNRLKPRKNPAYLKYLSEKYAGRGLERDHLISSVMGLKLNDLLIDMKTPAEHQEKHYKAGAEDFEGGLVNALENLFDYIENLQNRKRK